MCDGREYLLAMMLPDVALRNKFVAKVAIGSRSILLGTTVGYGKIVDVGSK
jgi:hypothetical protein